MHKHARVESFDLDFEIHSLIRNWKWKLCKWYYSSRSTQLRIFSAWVWHKFSGLKTGSRTSRLRQQNDPRRRSLKHQRCRRPSRAPNCWLGFMNSWFSVRRIDGLRVGISITPRNKSKWYQSGKLTARWLENGPWMKMYFLLKMGIFHCYVSLPVYQRVSVFLTISVYPTWSFFQRVYLWKVTGAPKRKGSSPVIFQGLLLLNFGGIFNYFLGPRSSLWTGNMGLPYAQYMLIVFFAMWKPCSWMPTYLRTFCFWTSEILNFSGAPIPYDLICFVVR